MKTVPNQIIEGRVHHKRDLGGIVFLELESPQKPKPVLVVAQKKTLVLSLFAEIKSIQINDYCQFEVKEENRDLIIVSIFNHFKKHHDFFWDSQQLGIVRAYAFIIGKVREYFEKRFYTEVRLPSIHPGKNKGDIFDLDFFNQSARLSSSNALFLDIYTIQLQRAFSIQKSFRAEKSHTGRHLSEFDMLEVSRINSTLEETMTELENLLKFLVDKLACSPFAEYSPLNFADIKEKKFRVVPYQEIERMYSLEKRGLGKYERDIAKNGPVFVTHFPREIASWRAKPLDDGYSRSFNLLLPNAGEAAEGTERQSDREEFQRVIQKADASEQLEWYLKMLPYSEFLLSGFGLGVERLAMWLLGLKNIREVHPIYRDTGFSELK